MLELELVGLDLLNSTTHSTTTRWYLIISCGWRNGTIPRQVWNNGICYHLKTPTPPTDGWKCHCSLFYWIPLHPFRYTTQQAGKFMAGNFLLHIQDYHFQLLTNWQLIRFAYLSLALSHLQLLIPHTGGLVLRRMVALPHWNTCTASHRDSKSRTNRQLHCEAFLFGHIYPLSLSVRSLVQFATPSISLPMDPSES